MKKLVYVVDDQPSVLDAIAFLLRSIDSGWDVSSFSNPRAALSAVQCRPPDLVLSDHMMPEIRGSDLLEAVRVAAPDAVRVIMSGHVDLNTLSLILSAHQYIAKPFDIVRFSELVRRTFAAQDRMRRQGLHTIITGLRSLPALPHLYYTLLADLENEYRSMDTLGQTISGDPGLSSKVLQLANSPLFGRGSLVTLPADGVMCIGTELVKAIVLSQEIFKRYEGLAGLGLDVPRLWNHCWTVAQLARRLCVRRELSRTQADEAFLAGLLHELGLLVLADNLPQPFQVAAESARKARSPLVPALVEVLQVTPAEVGSFILELWGLPPSVITAVAEHEHPLGEAAGGFSITTALYVANQLACRRSPPDDFGVPEWNGEYLRAAGCDDRLATWEQLGE